MERTLINLIASLQAAVSALDGPLKVELQESLHDANKLPDKRLVRLAAEAENLLDQAHLLIQPSVELLADNFLAYLDTQCLWAAVSLQIPDKLKDGPRSVPELAEICEVKPDRLRQVLRVLYSKGIFSFDANTKSYGNNRASEFLSSDHWTQWHRWVDLYSNEFYDMARGIPKSLKLEQKRTPAQINYDTDKSIIEVFQEADKLDKLIGTIGAGAVAQAPGMIADYPWETIAENETILDIGGGSGAFMASILRSCPAIKGAILDLSKVIDMNCIYFQPGGQFEDVGDRVQLMAGDFFAEIPAFKVYTIKWCLHDWTDEKAIIILKNIRRAIIESSQSRLVIIEAVLTEGKKGRLARFGDITMMVASGGRERDLQEWRQLAEAGGWHLESVRPLRNAWPSALELRPA